MAVQAPFVPPGSSARGSGLANIATQILEWVGLLNNGSSKSPPTPSTEDAAKTTGIMTNSLNVTRVGGVVALIAAAGAAALAIFHVNKATDKPAIVAAAYISAGVITAAALIAVAIIISTDVRARATTNLGSSSANLTSSPVTAAETDAKAFSDTWKHALTTLQEVNARLQHKTEDPLNAWLDASGLAASTGQLHPAGDRQTVQARLQACQSRVLSRLESIIDETDTTMIQNTRAEIQTLLDNMERILEN